MSQAGKAKLSFGFKPVRPPSGNAGTSRKQTANAFGEDEEDAYVDSGLSGAATGKASTSRLDARSLGLGKTAMPASKADKLKLQEAELIDASIFDYDATYDTIKEAERKVRAARLAEDASKKPKYVDGILESAEQRKRDRLRAEARAIQKQREAEGGEFADTEAFVTNAYKEQQAQLAKAEAQDEQAEAEQRKNSKGMTSFYRDMLEQSSAIREAAVSASLKSQQDPVDSHAPAPQRSEGDKAQEARQRGLTVELNDDNEIVDKRQLLSKGLNVVSKSGRQSIEKRDEAETKHDKRDRDRKRQEEYETRMNRDSQRARQSAQIEQQMLELERTRQQQEEQERLRELERVNAKRNDVAAISDAKQRYLERKRKKELEQT